MISDFDQLIRDADPARYLSPSSPNPAAIRTGQTRQRARRTPGQMTRAMGVALSVAVVTAVAVVVLATRPGAPAGRLGAGGRDGGTRLTARALPSRYYCTKRGGNLDLLCGAHPPHGFVHVGVSSEALVDATFNAPIALDSKHRFYEATFLLTHSSGCDAGSLGTPSLLRIRAGERVTLQTFVPYSCPGVVRVILRYVPDDRTAEHAAVLPPGSTVIGRTQVSIH